MMKLTPAYLVNEAGGIIAWDSWLKREKPDHLDLTAMMFADGTMVNSRGEQAQRYEFDSPTFVRDEMRQFANGRHG